MIKWESVPWCGYFDKAIDDELVNELKPDCIDEYNGCGHCPSQIQKEIFQTK